MPNPSYFTLVPTLGTALVILFCDDEIMIGRILSFKPFVWIGLISYSAYLIHQPVFVFYRVKYLEVSVFEYLSLIGFIQLMAVFTWKFVENPFRNRESISFKSIAVIIMIYFILFRSDLASIFVNKELAFRTDQTSQCLISDNLQTTNNESGNTAINDELFEYGLKTLIGKQCFENHFHAPKTTKPALCRIHQTNDTSNNPPPVYFLFGDSLSLVMLTAFQRHTKYHGMFAALHGCSPFVRENLTLPQGNPNGKSSFLIFFLSKSYITDY
jgi:hypothetical protein